MRQDIEDSVGPLIPKSFSPKHLNILARMEKNIAGYLFILVSLKTVCCTVVSQTAYTKLRLPHGHMTARNGTEETGYKTEADCAFACNWLGDGECNLYQFLQEKCILGVLNVSDAYIPSYVMEGIDVMVKPEKVLWNALTNVTHIGFLGISAAATRDAALDDERFDPVSMPEIPMQSSAAPVFGHVQLKDGLVACGGLQGTTVIKKCWQWTFLSGDWREMPGELSHGHYYGTAVIVGDKLWMFMGRPTYNTLPQKKVESYDLNLGFWSEESDANVEYGVSHFAAIVYDVVKVLIVCGMRDLINYGTYKTYVFNTADGSYTRKGDLFKLPLSGYSTMGCAIKPWDTNTILCAGGVIPGAYQDKIREFHIDTEDWAPEDDTKDLLPEILVGNLFAIGSNIYFVTKSVSDAEKTYRYEEGGSPSAWELIESTDVSYGYGQNFVYNMPYHKLL